MVRKSNAVSVASVLMIIAFTDRSWITPVDGVRILAVSTVAGKSHWNFMSAVLRSLTDAGHHVTVFTQFLDGDRENYTEVDTSGELPMTTGMDFMDILRTFRTPRDMLSMQTKLVRKYCDIIYSNGRFVDILRTGLKSNFDLIIVEPLVLMDCVSYMANALGVPIIYLLPYPMITHAEREYTGHMSNPACVSHILAHQSVPKTFVQRMANTGMLMYSILLTGYDIWTIKYNDPKPYDMSPTVNPSIIFQNTMYITDASRPIAQNVINIGGIHLKSPKNIPKNILDFIEDAPHGVIYFTFGSVITFSTLPDHLKETFKNALSQVPQKVLWKYEGEMKDKPNNVMTQKWFPQREILLHPNVKLFISHGGISGVYESVDAGVPILGFPTFYDQPRNIEHLVHNEMAISMDLLTVTKDTLLTSILELINNEKYIKNAKKNSVRFKDRPMTPEKSVVYWTEYVIRHKGAPHLKSYSLKLTWYQYFLLDVIAIILMCIFLFLFIVYKLFKLILYCKSIVFYLCNFKCSQNVKVKSQ